MKKIILLCGVLFQLSALSHPLFMCSRYLGQNSRESLPLHRGDVSDYKSCPLEDVDLNLNPKSSANYLKNILIASSVSGAVGLYYLAFHDVEMNELGLSVLGMSAVVGISAACLRYCALPQKAEDPELLYL